MIKEVLLENNPREKVLRNGIESLQDYELLSIILRTGSKDESVLQLSNRVLDMIGGIECLKYANYSMLTKLKGIKKAKAIEILAIIEIAKRINKNKTNIIINNPRDVYDLLGDEMKHLTQEHFYILILNHKHHLIRKKLLFIGCVSMSVVSPREIFQEILAYNGSCAIIVHNHPSGDPFPSKEDISLTSNLKESAKLMNISILDHIIIGWNSFYSIEGRQKFNINENALL